MSDISVNVASGMEGKYLGFQLKNEDYAISIFKVKEIIEVFPITKVPKMPDFIEGVINLRGKVIPIVDLNKKFGLGNLEKTKENCIIITEVQIDSNIVLMGILVDKVTEVFYIRPQDLAKDIEFGAADVDFISSFAKIGERVIILLDIDRVLSTAEVTKLKKIEETKGGNK